MYLKCTELLLSCSLFIIPSEIGGAVLIGHQKASGSFLQLTGVMHFPLISAFAGLKREVQLRFLHIWLLPIIITQIKKHGL